MKDITLIVTVWDRSGSMGPVQLDAIGGFNTFIEKEKQEVKPSLLSHIQFDHEYNPVFRLVPMREVKPLDTSTYKPRGMTALLDAIGISIDETGAALDKLSEDEKPNKVLFVIYTDGLENSSKKYDNKRINEMITRQTEIYKWEFLFLAATQDAIAQGTKMGFTSQNCVQTDSNEVGNFAVGDTVHAMAASYRAGGQSAVRGLDKAELYRMSVGKEEERRKQQNPKGSGSKA